MPSTLVEFIKKDGIVKKELEEFEGEFEREEIIDVNFYIKKNYFSSFTNLFSHHLLWLYKKRNTKKPQKKK